MYNNKKFYLSKYIFWRRQNLFRWIELSLCIGCITLAIILFHTPLHIITRTVLLVVNASYLFITFVDVVSWIQLRPMSYKTWIMFATGGFLMFWLCGGLLAFVRIKEVNISVYACAVYFVTGITYLLDCLWIIVEYISWTRGHQITPIKEFTDKAVSTCCLFDNGHYEGQSVKKRPKYPIVVKPRNVVTLSYGGTFPVSKDQPPLPSPDTNRSNFGSYTQSWQKSSISISSRRRNHGDTYRKEFRQENRQKSADIYQSTTNISETVSVTKPVRPASCRSAFTDSFSARISEPSTVQSLSRISEKTSKHSLPCSYDESPREDIGQSIVHQHIGQNRGARGCDCPLITCANCLEAIQNQTATHEEKTDGKVFEEPLVTVSEMSYENQFTPVQDSPRQQCQKYMCTICGKTYHHQQSMINVTPYYCKCTANKREELESQKLKDEDSFKSHLCDHQEHPKTMKRTELDSELGQYYSEVFGKRNGLDPEDQPKYRSRSPYNRNLHCQSTCKGFRRDRDSSTSTDTPRCNKKCSSRIIPKVSYFEQPQNFGGALNFSQYEKSTDVDGLQKPKVDGGVMAVKKTSHVPVQARREYFIRDAESQATEPIPAKVTVSVNTLPDTYEDPLAILNFVAPVSFINQGIVHSVEEQTETVDSLDVIKCTSLPVVQPVVCVSNKKSTSATSSDAESELECVEKFPVVENEYKLCYKPCHHPPVCPICFDERKHELEAQKVCCQTVDVGMNTEPEKRRCPFFRRKNK